MDSRKWPYLNRLLAVFLVLFITGAAYCQLKRSRAEGLVEVRASNTEGFANLWTNAELSLEQRNGEFFFEPKIGGAIGLASVMHLSGVSGVPKGRTIGTTELHAQLTTPRNDKLRLFGFGISGDLLLSTTEDTLTKEPKFMPYIGFTGLFDIDLIRLIPWMPLKLYANITNIDDEKLMLYLDAISLRGGLEYKGPRHSLFCSGAIGLYKEKPEYAPANAPANTYNNVTITAYPGIRYRIGKRMSLVGRAKLMLISQGNSQYLPRQIFGFSLLWEMPLFFRDTDAEAIRTLIFVERKKKEIKGEPKQAQKREVSDGILPSAISSDIDPSTLRVVEDDYYKRKEELKKYREQALEEMKKIEEMLE